VAGLAKICKQLGGIRVRDRDGNAVDWVWDYATDAAVRSHDMPQGSERWKASERARWARNQPKT
jgi:hypothetical protein